MLSDDVPLVVSRQLLQTFAQELGRLEPGAQTEIAHYTLAQIQPRVVSFEEQVILNLIASPLKKATWEIVLFGILKYF